jgi:hypothetical protein
MSISSRTARDMVTIERASSTQSDTGGQVRTFGIIQRGSLPTSMSCRIVPLRAEEHAEFGLRGARSAWKLLFSTDPSLTVADRVRFAESSGVERIAVVVEPSLDLDRQGRLFRAVVEESENEQ